MYKFCSLFSGSSGNATYIGTTEEGVLIDAGKNMKAIVGALAQIGVEPGAVKAIFITHEHSDHIGAVRVFCNKYHIPVYSSRGTLEYMDMHGHLNGDFPVYEISSYADIGNYHVECYSTSHDVRQPQCYNVQLPDLTKVAMVTDTGIMTDEIFDGLKGAETVLIESNHDVSMVSVGSYPYSLKRRILSNQGHICNEVCAETVSRLVATGTKHILLAHLSLENNLPELAYQTTLAKLLEDGYILNEDFTLQVAARDEVTEVEM